METFRTLASIEHAQKVATTNYLKGICNYFDIVTSPYTDLDGNRLVGLFLIIYKESSDNLIKQAKNVVGLKITSQDTYPSAYRVSIPKRDCPKLKSDSFVYVNHPYTLSAKTCVHVCRLPECLFHQVANKLLMYNYSTQNQLMSLLLNRLSLKN